MKPTRLLLSAAALFAVFSVVGIVMHRREPAVIWAAFATLMAAVALAEILERRHKAKTREVNEEIAKLGK